MIIFFEQSEHCDHISQTDAWKEFEVWELAEAEKWKDQMTDKIAVIENAIKNGWKIPNPSSNFKIYKKLDYYYYWEVNLGDNDICLGTWEQIITDKSFWKCIYGEELVCS